jgi:hypothetical protein
VELKQPVIGRRSLLLGVGVVVACAGTVWAAFRPSRASAQPAPASAEPDATALAPKSIEGFRRARFGMSEAQVRQAVQQDFPAVAARLSRMVHARERTIVLSVSVDNLLPDAGPARISYILGAASKQLVLVNIVWVSDGATPARDEALVAAANNLRDFLISTYEAHGDIVTNRQVGEAVILVFRVEQADGRMVILMLSGIPAAGRRNRNPAPPPLTMQLSYIRDVRHPDVFRIERDRF